MAPIISVGRVWPCFMSTTMPRLRRNVDSSRQRRDVSYALPLDAADVMLIAGACVGDMTFQQISRPTARGLGVRPQSSITGTTMD